MADRTSLTFKRVALQFDPPTPSWTAYRHRRTGSLTIDPGRRQAVFSPKDGDAVTLADILDVGVGTRGGDRVNTYVEVRFGEMSKPRVAYLRDGGLLGWSNLLKGSNLRMARSFAACLMQDS